MNIEMNTNLVPLFSGTYGTFWEVLETDDDGNELEVEYKQDDFMKSIADSYQDNASEIVRDLEIPWIKAIKFMRTYWSPREYNFATDELDLELEIDGAAMLAHLDSLKSDPKFDRWLRDRYTSRDGFISFTPNNYRDLVSEIKTEGREYSQALGALIRYLASDKFEEIEEMVYEDWQGNGYGGLNYQVLENHD